MFMRPVSGALLLVTLGLSSPSIAQLKLYDNFRSKRIDPSKWVGNRLHSLEVATEIDVSKHRTRREEGNRRLRISQTGTLQSRTAMDRAAVDLALDSPDPAGKKHRSRPVDQMQLVDCGNSQTFTTVGFFGDYFNPTGATNGQTGDIVASIRVTGFNTNGYCTDMSTSVSQCQDPQCNGQTTLISGSRPSAARKYEHTFSCLGSANHQFVFRLNSNPSIPLAYTVPDSFPPGSRQGFSCLAQFPTVPLPLDRFVGRCTFRQRLCEQ
jgi:hypothetical protein